MKPTFISSSAAKFLTVSMFALTTLGMNSAFADPAPKGTACTSEQDATPANIMSCPFGNPAKTTLAMDWMRDVKIQRSNDFVTLAKLLSTVLADSRTGNFVADLIDNGSLDPQVQAYLVHTFSTLLPQSELVKLLQASPAPDSAGSPMYIAAFMAYNPASITDPTLAQAISKIINSYYNYSSDIYMNTPDLYIPGSTGDVYTKAMNEVTLGAKGGILPAIDRLGDYSRELQKSPDSDCSETSGSGRQYWDSWYLNQIAQTLQTLGGIREPRAKDAIKNFLGFKCTNVADAAQKAMDRISTGETLGKIRKGDKVSIKWGEDFIRDHDGAYHDDEMAILDALSSIVRTNSQIKAFAAEEYNSGYHEGDPELNAKLKALGGVK